MEENKKFIERILFFILMTLIALSIFFFFFNLMNYYSILEKRIVYSKIIVGDRAGFDINGTALTFGRITPKGTSASRNINLINFYNKKVKVEILAEGDIARFISISENNFILQKNETRKIGFVVTSPENTEYGTYDGNVIIVVKRIWFWYSFLR